jgi:hypothetical protein
MGAIKAHPDGHGYAVQLTFNGQPGNWIWITPAAMGWILPGQPARQSRLTSEQVSEWRTVYDPATDPQSP